MRHELTMLFQRIRHIKKKKKLSLGERLAYCQARVRFIAFDTRTVLAPEADDLFYSGGERRVALSDVMTFANTQPANDLEKAMAISRRRLEEEIGIIGGIILTRLRVG